MEVRVIFMDATAEKVFKNVDNVCTKDGLLVIREGDWLYKYPLEHIFSIVHKHEDHWERHTWKKEEFTKQKDNEGGTINGAIKFPIFALW